MTFRRARSAFVLFALAAVCVPSAAQAAPPCGTSFGQPAQELRWERSPVRADEGTALLFRLSEPYEIAVQLVSPDDSDAPTETLLTTATLPAGEHRITVAAGARDPGEWTAVLQAVCQPPTSSSPVESEQPLSLTVTPLRRAVPANAWTIIPRGGYVRRIGRLGRPWTLRQAMREFGRPASRTRRYGRTACRVVWKRAQVLAWFGNLGGRQACDRRYGLFSYATLRSRRFATREGLRVGMTVDELRLMYPEVERVRNSWWLAEAPCRIGSCPDPYYPTVEAISAGGKVRAFRVTVGAAGD